MERDKRSECYSCVHHRKVPCNAHISCKKPSIDVLRSGNAHGIKRGWFIYPYLYDPVWKESLCPNFEAAISPAISQAVSPETAPTTS